MQSLGIITMKKKILFTLIMLSITSLLIILVLEVFSRYYVREYLTDKISPYELYKYSDTNGWTPMDGTYKQVRKDFDVIYNVKDGKRVSINTGDKATVNFFGDSFMFGVGQNDNTTIPSLVAGYTGNLHVNNYGAPGYNPIQYYLKYNEAMCDDCYNVVLVYTGDDYTDVMIKLNKVGYPQPYIEVNGDEYSLSMAKDNARQNEVESILKSEEFIRKRDFENKVVKGRKVEHSGEIQFHNVLKRFIKGIPFVVKMRNKVVNTDTKYVDEAIKRILFLSDKYNKEKTLFVMLPSISIVQKISTQTNEGYFFDKMTEAYEKNGFHVVKLELRTDDFWRYEGHTSLEGNKKIARIIADKLSKMMNK